MARTKRTSTTRTSKSRKSHGIANGYRSGLEELVSSQLREAGIIDPQYEAYRIEYTPPVKARTYKPDFTLPNGIVIETKGRFLTADRQKHKHIKEEHPDLDVRFVFSRAKDTISKASRTTYADWCQRYGFQWAQGEVPQEWIDEPVDKTRLKAIERAKK